MSKKKCPGCGGKGKYEGFTHHSDEDPCETCEGFGYVHDEDKVDTEEIEVGFEDDEFWSHDEVLDIVDDWGILD